MAQFEREMTQCFTYHNEHFMLDNNQIKLAYRDFVVKYPTFVDILRVIAAPFLGVNGYHGKNKDRYEQEPKFYVRLNILGKRIYEYAGRLYLVGTDNRGVLYHNFCHGMFVAYITYEYFAFDPDPQNKKPKNSYFIASYVFAGLFHDAGHPGLSNNIYLLDKVFRSNLLKYVTDKLPAIIPDSQLNAVSVAIETLKSFVNSEQFVLENMHVV